MNPKPSIPEVLPQVFAFQRIPGNEIGGSLHAIFDGNTKDSDVEWCIEHAREKGDTAAVVLGETLRRMSRTQRWKIVRAFNLNYHKL